MKLLLRIFLMAIVIVTYPALKTEATGTAEEILHRAVAAIGGDQAVRSVETLHLIWDVDILGMAGTLEEWYQAPDKHYYRLETPVMGQTECRNGTIEWKLDQNGQITSNPIPEKQMNEKVILLFHGLINPGYLTVTYKGLLEKDGVQYETVELKDPSEDVTSLMFLDRKTHLPVFIDGEEDGIAASTKFEDYKAVEGILIAHTTAQSIQMPGIPPITFTLKSADVNPMPESGIFDPPQRTKDYEFSSEDGVIEVPIDLVGEHLFIKVTLNGKGPFDFVLDSGAGSSLVDKTLASELELVSVDGMKAVGIGGVEPLGAVSLDTFEIGGFSMKGLRVYSADMNSLSKAFGRPVHGIAGYDLFVRAVIKIDYQKQTLALLDSDRFVYDGQGKAVPGEINSNLINVQGKIDGKYEGLMRVDTGASGSVHLHGPFVKENDYQNQITNKMEVQTMGAGGHQTSVMGLAQSLEIGSFTFSKPMVTIPQNPETGALGAGDSIATIGNGIWSQFTVIFDYARNRLILEPNENYGKPQVPNRAGCAVAFKNQKFEVISVMPDSPADTAGIQPGDVIFQVNKAKDEELTLDAIKEHFSQPTGTKLKIRILRDDKKMTKRIVLTDIFS